MAKNKTRYVCSQCGAYYPRWFGKCPNCGSWNSITEEVLTPTTKEKDKANIEIDIKPITDIREENNLSRLSTGFKNLDEAFYSGFVNGQVILLSGEPGIGKSTLLLQVAYNIAVNGKKVLYISGEEAVNQIYLRGKRLNAISENLYILSETNLDNILSAIEKLNPDFLIIDSIQTVYSSRLESVAGSVSQVRECSGRLTEIAKQKGIATVLVGQITKEGSIAGPKILEHLVDTVAYFEGERGQAYRVLKIIKNRFGATGEIAVFNMTSSGLKEVNEPSALFLQEKPKNKSGSVIFPFTEGSKPILVEIQALVSKTFYPVPQRKTQGIDINKLSIITAILEKEAGLKLGDKDIFINIVGGIYIREPAVDLPLALAIASSYFDKPIPPNIAVFGELGLTGETRSVYYTDLRIKECKRFNIDSIIVPKSTDIDERGIIKVANIKEAINKIFKEQ